jgi:hypothetical protein
VYPAVSSDVHGVRWFWSGRLACCADANLTVVAGIPSLTFVSLGFLRSCCFLPESVGVGSSGALMGMLSSWVVWIIFRWYVSRVTILAHHVRAKF